MLHTKIFDLGNCFVFYNMKYPFFHVYDDNNFKSLIECSIQNKREDQLHYNKASIPYASRNFTAAKHVIANHCVKQ